MQYKVSETNEEREKKIMFYFNIEIQMTGKLFKLYKKNSSDKK